MFLKKMATGSHFGCPKITLYRISCHFRSIPQFYFVWNLITKWLPAAILDVRDTTLFFFGNFYFCDFFNKMAAGGHFGCPNFTFDRISGHFRSIRNFIFFWNFWQNGWRRPFWMSEIHFRSHFWPFQIYMQLLIFLGIFDKMAAGRPFWMSEIHFRSHFWSFQIDRSFWISEIHFRSQFWPFQINTELFFLGGHFVYLKITLDRISGNFRLISHFGCPKFTFDGISGNFRSIRNFIFF